MNYVGIKVSIEGYSKESVIYVPTQVRWQKLKVI